jgi:hypothetical protein
MVVVIFRRKATFISGGFDFSPLGTSYPSGVSGRQERGALQSRHADYEPFDKLRAGIIPGQTITKEKLQRVKELQRDMTPAEETQSVWQDLRANKLGVHFRRHKSSRGSSLIFTVTR